MPCGSEHPTRENHAMAFRAQIQTLHQFRSISIQWFAMVRERKMAKLQKKLAFYNKWQKWMQNWRAKKKQLQALFQKHLSDPSSVSIDDWDALLKGSEHTFIAMLRLPRSRWSGGEQPLDGAALKSIMLLKYKRSRMQITNDLNKAMEHIHKLMGKAKEDEASVGSDEWSAALDAVKKLKIKNLDPMGTTPYLRGYVERARVRDAGKQRAKQLESRRKKAHTSEN